MSTESNGKNGAIVKTNPDPTTAVKEALTLAIKNINDKFDTEIRNIREGLDLSRDQLNDKLSAMSNGINDKFLANKDLVDQLAKANAVALSAALQTQKESAAKSEMAMADMLKQLQSSFESSNKATNEKIDRLTSRLDTGEGRGYASTESKHDRTTDKGQALVIISLVIAGIGLLLGIGSFLITKVTS